jgi:hypothetical protein
MTVILAGVGTVGCSDLVALTTTVPNIVGSSAKAFVETAPKMDRKRIDLFIILPQQHSPVPFLLRLIGDVLERESELN